MAQLISCPECERKLRVPDELLGKKVKCPTCKAMFTAADLTSPKEDEPRPRAKTPPASERVQPSRPARKPREVDEERVSPRRRVERDEVEDDAPRSKRRPVDDEDSSPRRLRSRVDDEDDARPRRRRPRDDEDDYDDRPRPGAAGWQSVHFGLRLLLISIALGFAAFAVNWMGNIVAQASTPSPVFRPDGRIDVAPTVATSVGIATVTQFGAMFMALAQFVMKLIAYWSFMKVPANSDAKGAATTTFALAVSQFVLGVVGFLIVVVTVGIGFATFSPAAFVSAGVLMIVFYLTLAALGIAECVSCLIFFRRVAEFLRNHDLAQSIRYLITLFAVGMTMMLLMFGILVATFGAAATTAMSGQGFGQGSAGAFGGALVLAMGVGCIGGFALLAWSIWYLITLFQMHALVGRRVAYR
jgi:predicted Zn finger-like uncharacterized protein